MTDASQTIALGHLKEVVMKTSPYMNINRIEFMVTYQCSGKCIHCSVGNRLNHSDGFRHVHIKESAETIEGLSRMFSVSSVMTFGGEPLLYPDAVCAVHHTASLCGIKTRQLITNGYFTKDDEQRKDIAEALHESGLTDLLISVDTFHQHDIPIEPVRHFAKCAKQAGIPKVKFHPAWVVNEEHENPYNVKTREILSELSDLDIPVSSGNNIFMAGNAVRHLSEYYAPPNLNLSDVCGSLPYTAPLTNITSLSIVPNGDVMVCGFTIGNIYTERIEDIVLRYNPYENDYMRAIISGGAAALIKTAEANGIKINVSECYSICDLCYKICQQMM